MKKREMIKLMEKNNNVGKWIINFNEETKEYDCTDNLEDFIYEIAEEKYDLEKNNLNYYFDFEKFKDDYLIENVVICLEDLKDNEEF